MELQRTTTFNSRPLGLSGDHEVGMGGVLMQLAYEVAAAIAEGPVRALGYGILRYGLRRRQIDWQGHAVLVMGILAWALIAALAYEVWRWMADSS